jgi:hypothetical protein
MGSPSRFQAFYFRAVAGLLVEARTAPCECRAERPQCCLSIVSPLPASGASVYPLSYLCQFGGLCPGLTKVPIDGQPKTIVKELEDMARTYIKVRGPRRLTSAVA